MDEWMKESERKEGNAVSRWTSFHFLFINSVKKCILVPNGLLIEGAFTFSQKNYFLKNEKDQFEKQRVTFGMMNDDDSEHFVVDNISEGRKQEKNSILYWIYQRQESVRFYLKNSTLVSFSVIKFIDLHIYSTYQKSFKSRISFYRKQYPCLRFPDCLLMANEVVVCGMILVSFWNRLLH